METNWRYYNPPQGGVGPEDYVPGSFHLEAFYDDDGVWTPDDLTWGWINGVEYRYRPILPDYALMTPEDLSAHRQALEAAEAEAKRKEDEGMEEAYELLAEILDAWGHGAAALHLRTYGPDSDDTKAARLIRKRILRAARVCL